MSLRSIAVRIIQPLRRVKRLYEMSCLRRRHSMEMERRLKITSPEYGEYLKTQLIRTLYKHNAPLPDRARLFISQIARHVEVADCRILCVGCRNAAELDFFRELGARSVTGIDIYSERPDILVMDMHDMAFGDGSFDLIYSSHSFEHALNPEKAAAQMRRVLKPGGCVAIEVPVRYRTREADIQDYQSLENLLKLFQVHSSSVIWSEMVEPGKEWENPENTVLRALFRSEPISSSPAAPS